MADHALCSRCRHANPPENRFCGSCGISLQVGSDLAERRRNSLAEMGHALPAMLGPAGKVLALGLVTLAAQVGLSWLRQRIKEVLPLTSTIREPDTAMLEQLSAQSLKGLIGEQQGDYRSRVIAWRATRSIVVTEWTSSGTRSSGGYRGGSSHLEPER